jgi:hypothetical protein
MNTEPLLKFGKGNHKLGKQIHTFTLPSGYTCPGAYACMTKADKETGQIVDGKAQTFRCFAASSESRFKNVRSVAWHNLELLKTAHTGTQMTNLIRTSLPKDASIVRIHVAGISLMNATFALGSMLLATIQGSNSTPIPKAFPSGLRH